MTNHRDDAERLLAQADEEADTQAALTLGVLAIAHYLGALLAQRPQMTYGIVNPQSNNPGPWTYDELKKPA